MKNFESLMDRVDAELAQAVDMQLAAGGMGAGFFLGDRMTLVDCMFAPFLERMAASVPYYKGLVVRGNERWPHVTRWFDAMETRESFRGIQSDYYTHAHDLPPQIGGCRPHPEAEAYRSEIDGEGGSWRLPLREGVEPLRAGCGAARGSRARDGQRTGSGALHASRGRRTRAACRSGAAFGPARPARSPLRQTGRRRPTSHSGSTAFTVQRGTSLSCFIAGPSAEHDASSSRLPPRPCLRSS